MGPHSFKCGKLGLDDGGQTAIQKLQWGRTLSSAESRRFVHFDARKKISFNGAALFQVRKDLQVRVGQAGYVKLQWGRTLSSAESILIQAVEINPSTVPT